MLFGSENEFIKYICNYIGFSIVNRSNCIGSVLSIVVKVKVVNCRNSIN